MSFRGDEGVWRAALGLACLGITLTFAAPASAGFLERLFGAFRHSFQAPRPPAVHSFADPSGDDRIMLLNATPAALRWPTVCAAATGITFA